MGKKTNGFCEGHQCLHKGKLRYYGVTKENLDFFLFNGLNHLKENDSICQPFYNLISQKGDILAKNIKNIKEKIDDKKKR